MNFFHVLREGGVFKKDEKIQTEISRRPYTSLVNVNSREQNKW